MISLIINILLIILCIKLLPYSIQLGLYCYYLQLLRIEKRLRTCHTAPKKSIANEGARKMLEKVEEPYTVPGIKYRNVDKKLLEKHGIHPDYIDDGLTSYINLCHRVGYEVVIRPQKGTQGDTECNPAATDKRLKKLYRKYMQLLSLRRPYRF